MKEENIEILKEQSEEDVEKRKNKIKRDIRIVILILIILLILLIFTVGTGFALLNILDDSTNPKQITTTGLLEAEYKELEASFKEMASELVVTENE